MIRNIGEVMGIMDSYKAKDWVENLPAKNITNLTDGGNSLNVYGEQTENSLTSESIGDKKQTFGQVLADSINRVNDLQREANVAIEKLASGESENLHETMLIVEQAEIAYKMMNQIRQKVLDAYRDIMRMQI